jgi:beta-glucosidase
MYFKDPPLYPFGYGLSYTTFAYSNLKTSAPTLAGDGAISVSVDVKNTGSRAGEEVVQLYVRRPGAAVDRPREELRGFKRVGLAPGETKTVEMPLAGSLLGHWDSGRHAFVVEPGPLDLLIGASSADIRAQQAITVQ